MKNNIYPKSRRANIVVQDAGNEVLIYDLAKNKAYCLNQTSALVWQNCDGNNSVADISRELSGKAKIDVSDEMVWLALDGLKRDDLLENGDEFEINFNGLNRRQIIKKVGLASMIALPIISAVIAPTAAAAQSNNLLPFFSVCTASGQCASMNCDSASFGTTDGLMRCCVAGTTGGAHPGQIISAGSDICFPNCNVNAPNFCCSGQAQSAGSGPCGINQQFRCSCV
jgi:hypothetical protein